MKKEQKELNELQKFFKAIMAAKGYPNIDAIEKIVKGKGKKAGYYRTRSVDGSPKILAELKEKFPDVAAQFEQQKNQAVETDLVNKVSGSLTDNGLKNGATNLDTVLDSLESISKILKADRPKLDAILSLLQPHPKTARSGKKKSGAR